MIGNFYRFYIRKRLFHTIGIRFSRNILCLFEFLELRLWLNFLKETAGDGGDHYGGDVVDGDRSQTFFLYEIYRFNKLQRGNYSCGME